MFSFNKQLKIRIVFHIKVDSLIPDVILNQAKEKSIAV